MDNKIKTLIQEREFSSLKDSHRVLLKWATGCGKSKMTIDLINYQCMNMLIHIKPVRVLFVVAERAHIMNWQDEFEKWNLRIDRVRIDVICYASLKNYKNRQYDIIVFDEAHHAFSEKRLAILEEMAQFNYAINNIYLLSATLSSGKQDMIENIFGKFRTSIVTLKDAIESGILPDPKIYVIRLELDDSKPKEIIQIGSDSNAPLVKWEHRNKYIFKKTSCRIKCTEAQKNLYITNQMEYWKQRYQLSHNEFQRTKWVNLGSQRKRFLGELKTAYVRRLLDKLPKGNRYVCFCASVAQAEALNSKNTIAAKKGDKHNKGLIAAFNAKNIDNLFAVGMITEGMNLTNIQTGIITQLDGKERLFIQKTGRVMRADSPKVFIIYYKDTQDEEYLKGALENIDSKYVKFLDINQLKTIAT